MLYILGIDLAWGDKNPDGLCCISVGDNRAQIEYVGISKGKVQLIEWVKKYTNQGKVLAMGRGPLTAKVTAVSVNTRQVVIQSISTFVDGHWK